MNARDKPTQRRRRGIAFRYGVWVTREGLRREVVRDGDVWRVSAYTSLTDGRPQQISEYSNQADLARAIAEMEAHGYQNDPGRRPRAARTVLPTRSRSARAIVATALICILLLAIEIFVLSR